MILQIYSLFLTFCTHYLCFNHPCNSCNCSLKRNSSVLIFWTTWMPEWHIQVGHDNINPNFFTLTIHLELNNLCRWNSVMIWHHISHQYSQSDLWLFVLMVLTLPSIICYTMQKLTFMFHLPSWWILLYTFEQSLPTQPAWVNQSGLQHDLA